MKKILLLLLLLLPIPASAARLFTRSNSDCISIPAPTAWSTEVTISAWVYIASTPTAITYVWYGNENDSTNFNLFADYSVALVELAHATNSVYTQSKRAITLSNTTWYHVLWTFQTAGATTRKLYVNGTDQGGMDVSTGGSQPPAGGTARIGCLDVGGTPLHFFDGRIADLAVWNLILTSSEITALSRGVRPDKLRATPPDLYYPLDGYASPEIELGTAKTKSTSISGTSKADGPPVLPR